MYKLPPFEDNGEFLKLEDVECKDSGIIFIYNEEKELMYIGKTNSIKYGVMCTINYMTGHHDVKHNYKYAKYTVIDEVGNLEDYKKSYINVLKPKLNRQDVETYKSEYYSVKYNKRCAEETSEKHKRKMRELVEQLPVYWNH